MVCGGNRYQRRWRNVAWVHLEVMHESPLVRGWQMLTNVSKFCCTHLPPLIFISMQVHIFIRLWLRKFHQIHSRFLPSCIDTRQVVLLFNGFFFLCVKEVCYWKALHRVPIYQILFSSRPLIMLLIPKICLVRRGSDLPILGFGHREVSAEFITRLNHSAMRIFKKPTVLWYLWIILMAYLVLNQ